MLGCDPKDCVKRLRRDKSGQTKGSGGTAGPRINRRVAAGDSSQAAAGGNLLEKGKTRNWIHRGHRRGAPAMLLLTNTCQSVQRNGVCGSPP